MLVGIVMAGGALVGLSYVTTFAAFYLFYGFNALGYVCGGPLPNQVLLSRWFDRARGKAMGVAYLGIGLGGAIVPMLVVRADAVPWLARRVASAWGHHDRWSRCRRRSSSASRRSPRRARRAAPSLAAILSRPAVLPAR